MIHRHVVTAPAALCRTRTVVLYKRQGMFSGMENTGLQHGIPHEPRGRLFFGLTGEKSRDIINGMDRQGNPE
ncbi:MAG: hypothetical protein CW742_02845 [Methanoregula sp.]|nr:MAG: hypothetical protein CW742_02845 [Methanoregula sp.]